MTCKHVRVGVGVLVKNPLVVSKIFCGIRKGSHGAGSLALPGGHLELLETWEECAMREVHEEMGILLQKVEFCHVTNDIMVKDDKHYVTIFLKAECKEDEEPINQEPHKCEGWKSYSWQELKDIHHENPSKLFGPLAKLVQEEPQSVLDFLS